MHDTGIQKESHIVTSRYPLPIPYFASKAPILGHEVLKTPANIR